MCLGRICTLSLPEYAGTPCSKVVAWQIAIFINSAAVLKVANARIGEKIKWCCLLERAGKRKNSNWVK